MSKKNAKKPSKSKKAPAAPPQPAKKKAAPKQQFFGGMEPPHNKDIGDALDNWLDAKEEQKRAGETTKLRHASLILQMQNVGCDAYPYIDRTTGKKRQVFIKREPKAATGNAPRKNRREDDVEIAEEVVDDTEADGNVEMRRVKRTAEHDNIADPFGATRELMDATMGTSEPS